MLKAQCQTCGNVVINLSRPCGVCGNINDIPVVQIEEEEEEEEADYIWEAPISFDVDPAALLVIKLVWRLTLFIVFYNLIIFYKEEAIIGIDAISEFFSGAGAQSNVDRRSYVWDFFIWGLPMAVFYWCYTHRNTIGAFFDKLIPYPFKFFISDIKLFIDEVSYVRNTVFFFIFYPRYWPYCPKWP